MEHYGRMILIHGKPIAFEIHGSLQPEAFKGDLVKKYNLAEDSSWFIMDNGTFKTKNPHELSHFIWVSHPCLLLDEDPSFDYFCKFCIILDFPSTNNWRKAVFAGNNKIIVKSIDEFDEKLRLEWLLWQVSGMTIQEAIEHQG